VDDLGNPATVCLSIHGGPLSLGSLIASIRNYSQFVRLSLRSSPEAFGTANSYRECFNAMDSRIARHLSSAALPRRTLPTSCVVRLNRASFSANDDLAAGGEVHVRQGDALVSALPILEVAIGLSFTYLLLALITTTVTEWITRVLNSRGTMLLKGLR